MVQKRENIALFFQLPIEQTNVTFPSLKAEVNAKRALCSGGNDQNIFMMQSK